uniref:Uncharacterized protein n=1 Tax=Caenorhabditis japonica TaxID=281687 RepID=A0A8R1IUQ6_CAEJA
MNPDGELLAKPVPPPPPIAPPSLMGPHTEIEPPKPPPPPPRIIRLPPPQPTIEDDRTFLARMSEQEALVNALSNRQLATGNELLAMGQNLGKYFCI